VLSWFKKKNTLSNANRLVTDIHSHLLPELDDGVQSFEQAEEIILGFQQLRYTKLITSPHVMSDAYRNTNETILEKLKLLQQYLLSKKIYITIESAAEYYLDEVLYKRIEHKEPLLTFGKNYLLFETNFLNEPLNLKDFIFIATSNGYTPVLAHPERYLYLQNDFNKLQDLLDRGILFQVNTSSITGYYSKPAQQTAFKLIDMKQVHFLGSDCHHIKQIRLLESTQHMKYFRKALELPLLNNSL